MDFSKLGLGELGRVSESSKQISLQFNTSLNTPPPSISQLRSNQNKQTRNGVAQLRGQAELLILRFRSIYRRDIWD